MDFCVYSSSREAKGCVTRQRPSNPWHSGIMFLVSLFLLQDHEPPKAIDYALFIFVFQIAHNYDA